MKAAYSQTREEYFNVSIVVDMDGITKNAYV
jgi:hypothetical protein